MNTLDLAAVTQYVEENIDTFHTNRLEKINKLKLRDVLKRKNPYLFRAKDISRASQFVEVILDAYLSSQEEGLLGGFLEGLAVFVGVQVYNGYKPSTDEFNGVDLIFENNGRLYIVEIKSGPKWANSSQIKALISNFEAAKQKLQPEYPHLKIVAVNGCAYGKEGNHSKKGGKYWKLCGQDFWYFISGDNNLYIDIIEPIGFRAKERNEAFAREYNKALNRFERQFILNYCDEEGNILWDKLIRLVSERRSNAVYPFEGIE